MRADEEEKGELQTRITKAREEQDDMMARFVDLEEALDTTKNEHQELIVS